jgi:hypothetical protein
MMRIISISSPMMPTPLLTPPYGELMATFSQKSVMGTVFSSEMIWKLIKGYNTGIRVINI